MNVSRRYLFKEAREKEPSGNSGMATDRQTDKRMDGRTDRQTDRQTLITEIGRQSDRN